MELKHLSKRFGNVIAVKDASVAFEAGRVHAVVGENGAGKSTLLRLAAGLLVPDTGEVIAAGSRLVPHTAAEAIRRGVAMVEQHFALVGVFTAFENVILGHEPAKLLSRARRATLARLSEIARDVGGDLPWDAPAESLSVGERQRLEIVRALYRDAKVLILDEPTAVLTPGEGEALYATVRRLKERGTTVVVVTHKLDEVAAHADTVTVMRKGEIISTQLMKDTTTGALAEAIMGGAVPEKTLRAAASRGEPALVLEGVRFGRALYGVDLTVHAGEVVGMAGVEGNGQHELVQILAGLARADAGKVVIAGGTAAVVHDDRQAEGLVLDASLRENLMLGELAAYTSWGMLRTRAIERVAKARLSTAGVVPADLDLPARALSGGNQQKIVVARAVARTHEHKVLVLAHPTRGVDIGAARAIHAEISAAATRGVAILVLGADLQELRTVSHRIVVLARGRIAAELPSSADDATIGRAMLGAGA